MEEYLRKRRRMVMRKEEERKRKKKRNDGPFIDKIQANSTVTEAQLQEE